METVYLALGSNVGDNEQHIAQAVELLAEKIQDTARAPLYKSKAVGYTDQSDFLNTAVRGRTSLSAEALLAFVKQVESQVGRVERFRWGPREIDIDVIFYGTHVVDAEGLQIPHRRFMERDFVLKPLVDLDPSFVDPLSGHTLAQLLEDLPPSQLAILT